MTRAFSWLLVVLGVAGEWTQNSLTSEGVSRSYYVYVPTSPFRAGILVLLHGSYGMFGGTFADFSGHASHNRADNGFNVAVNAEALGFVAVIPIGQATWNIGQGLNDVAFVHSAVSAVTSAQPATIGLPTIVLGFSSSGVALAAQLACTPLDDSITASVLGVHYRPDADFPSTCGAAAGAIPAATSSSKGRRLQAGGACASEWYGIGSGDVSIASLTPNPTEGVRAQLTARRDALLCNSNERWLETSPHAAMSCWEYPSCTDLGQLCVLNDVAHEPHGYFTSAAWTFLSACSSGSSAIVDRGSGVADSGSNSSVAPSKASSSAGRIGAPTSDELAATGSGAEYMIVIIALVFLTLVGVIGYFLWRDVLSNLECMKWAAAVQGAQVDAASATLPALIRHHSSTHSSPLPGAPTSDPDDDEHPTQPAI